MEENEERDRMICRWVRDAMAADGQDGEFAICVLYLMRCIVGRRR